MTNNEPKYWACWANGIYMKYDPEALIWEASTIIREGNSPPKANLITWAPISKEEANDYHVTVDAVAEAVDTLISVAKELNVTFDKHSFVRGYVDGQNPKYPMPISDWKIIMDRQALRMGWRPVYSASLDKPKSDSRVVRAVKELMRGMEPEDLAEIADEIQKIHDAPYEDADE